MEDEEWRAAIRPAVVTNWLPILANGWPYPGRPPYHTFFEQSRLNVRCNRGFQVVSLWLFISDVNCSNTGLPSIGLAKSDIWSLDGWSDGYSKA
jgi:hypothetical protein